MNLQQQLYSQVYGELTLKADEELTDMDHLTAFVRHLTIMNIFLIMEYLGFKESLDKKKQLKVYNNAFSKLSDIYFDIQKHR